MSLLFATQRYGALLMVDVHTRKICVCVDDTSESAGAVKWAARQACCGDELHIVTACQVSDCVAMHSVASCLHQECHPFLHSFRN